MSLIRKLAAGVVLATALVGTASALEIQQVNWGGTATAAGPGWTFSNSGTGGTNAAATSGGNVTTAAAAAFNGNAYSLASEIKWGSAAGQGVLSIVIDASTGNFPSGNVVGTLTLSGMTFNGAVTGSIFAFSCTNAPTPNANLSTGGGTGTQTAKFVISNLNSCVNGDFGVKLAIPVTLGDTAAPTVAPASNPTVTFGLVTESGDVPVDNGPTTVRVATVGSAFSVPVNTTGTANNWAALNPTPLFTTLATSATANGTSGSEAQLGTVQLLIKAATFTNMTGNNASNANIADVSDVDRLSLLLTSANFPFTGLDQLRYGTTGSSKVVLANAFASNSIELANTGNGSTSNAQATVTALSLTDLLTAREILLEDGTGTNANRAGAIGLTNENKFTVTPTLTLNPTFFNSPTLAAVNISSIFRQGTTITFPWFSSGTQASATGSTSILRIGNLTTSAINGYVSIFDSTKGTAANVNSVSIAGGVPASGELVLNSAQLQALPGVGDFGRADVQIILETNSANVTARRFVFNGASFTELSPGVAGAPQ